MNKSVFNNQLVSEQLIDMIDPSDEAMFSRAEALTLMECYASSCLGRYGRTVNIQAIRNSLDRLREARTNKD